VDDKIYNLYKQFFKLPKNRIVKLNAIYPLEILVTQEERTNSCRYLVVESMPPMRFYHGIEPRARMRKTIISNAQHVDGSVP
jgi:hypothetical protein